MVGLSDAKYSTRHMNGIDKDNLSCLFECLRGVEDSVGDSVNTKLYGSVLETEDYDMVEVTVEDINAEIYGDFYDEFVSVLENDPSSLNIDVISEEEIKSNIRFTLNRYREDGVFRRTRFNVSLESEISNNHVV